MYIQHVHKDEKKNKRKPESTSNHDLFIMFLGQKSVIRPVYQTSLNSFVVIHICRAVPVLPVNLALPPFLLSLLLAQQHNYVYVLQQSRAFGCNRDNSNIFCSPEHVLVLFVLK